MLDKLRHRYASFDTIFLFAVLSILPLLTSIGLSDHSAVPNQEIEILLFSSNLTALQFGIIRIRVKDPS